MTATAIAEQPTTEAAQTVPVFTLADTIYDLFPGVYEGRDAYAAEGDVREYMIGEGIHPANMEVTAEQARRIVGAMVLDFSGVI